MARRTSRRTALKQKGMAGVAAVRPGGVFRGRSAPITIAGKPVEIAVAVVTPSTIRITVMPLDGTVAPDHGALVAAATGKRAGRAPAAERFSPIRAGELTVRFTAAPPTVHVERRDGGLVQKLTLDPATAAVSF